MNTKETYRDYFANVQTYVKLTPLLDLAGVSRSNFSKFMRGSEHNHFVSVEKLSNLEIVVKSTVKAVL